MGACLSGWMTVPSPPPPDAAFQGPALAVGGADVGALCVVGMSAACSYLTRRLLPKLSGHVLLSTWWVNGKALQHRRLWLAGFPRVDSPPNFPRGTTDEMAADMFAWFSLCACVHVIAGTFTLPTVVLGWREAGNVGQSAFFFAIFFAVGWCLFDAVDGTMRAWLSKSFPTGCSGLAWPCPKRFWVRNNVLHNALWLTLALPMNAYLPDLDAYHYLACSLMVSMAWQHIIGCDMPKRPTAHPEALPSQATPNGPRS